MYIKLLICKINGVTLWGLKKMYRITKFCLTLESLEREKACCGSMLVLKWIGPQ